MPNTTAAPNRYVYPNRRNGDLEGYQVRFKRELRNGKSETISQYFSFSACGSAAKALKAARAWRDQNEKWMTHLSFRPKFPKKLHGRVQIAA